MTMHPEDAFNMTIQSYAAALEAVSKISACTPELAAFGLTRYYHGEHQFNYAVYRACLSMTIIEKQYAALQGQISLLQPSTVVASSTIPATQVSTVASVASPPYHKPPRLTMHPIPSTLRRSKRVKSKNTASVQISANCFKERQQAAVKSDAQYLGMMRYMGFSK